MLILLTPWLLQSHDGDSCAASPLIATPACRRSQQRWMSAGAEHMCASAGRVWFEVEVLAASGYMTVGFAGTNFRGEQLGGDERGWGIVKSGAAEHKRVECGKGLGRV